MKSLFVMMVMMITSTTFSQEVVKIANLQLGNSLEQTIKDANSLGYQLADTKSDGRVVTFLVPSNELSNYITTITIYADRHDDIVWLASVSFKAIYKSECFKASIREDVNNKFHEIFKVLYEKHGHPYQMKRKMFGFKEITWDTGNSFFYIKKNKNNIEYTKVDVNALRKTM